MRPMSPSFAWWIVVAVALIVAETLVVYLLRPMVPKICPATVYPAGDSGPLGRASTLSAAVIDLAAVAGEEQRTASAVRDGGALLVPAALPQTTEQRVRVPAPVEPVLRETRDREGTANAVER
jgi:hypothetical protein